MVHKFYELGGFVTSTFVVAGTRALWSLKKFSSTKMAAQAPGKISPLIKASRWSFLIAGVVYGSVRLSALNRKEKKRLDELERTRPEREAKQKAETLRKQKEEERELAKSAGVELPPDN